MKWESADLRVGLMLVLAAVVAVTSFIWLSPVVDEKSASFYTEFESIEGIAEQSPVQQRGFVVGRVDQITPRIDSTGALVFRVRFQVRSKLQTGESFPVLEGTTVRLVPPPVIGAGYLVLDPPKGGGRPLEPGATLAGARTTAVLDQVQTIADQVGGDVRKTLAGALALVDSLRSLTGDARTALTVATHAVETVDADLPRILAGVERELVMLDTVLRESRELTPALLATVDSVNMMIAESRVALTRVDRLVVERQPELERITASLDTTAMTLQHFMRAVSRRPIRALTGVKPMTFPEARPAERVPVVADTSGK